MDSTSLCSSRCGTTWRSQHVTICRSRHVAEISFKGRRFFIGLITTNKWRAPCLERKPAFPGLVRLGVITDYMTFKNVLHPSMSLNGTFANICMKAESPSLVFCMIHYGCVAVVFERLAVEQLVKPQMDGRPRHVLNTPYLSHVLSTRSRLAPLEDAQVAGEHVRPGVPWMELAVGFSSCGGDLPQQKVPSKGRSVRFSFLTELRFSRWGAAGSEAV